MMHHDIQHILKSFHITPDILQQRKEVASYIESLSNLIAERFFDHLLEHQEFSDRIDKQALPRLRRLKSDFIITLFNDELNQRLLEKIILSYNNYPFEMDSLVIASEFEVMSETIIDIASVNHQLAKHLKTVLKFLHVAEFVVQQSFSQHKSKVSYKQNNNLLILLETFFKMLSIHKSKHDYLLQIWNRKAPWDHSCEKLPTGDVTLCRFHDTLQKIKKQFHDIQEFTIDIDIIDTLHHDYHHAVNILYTLMDEKGSFERMQKQIEIIETISQNLFSELSKPFENSASLTFLTVHSGMRFIQTYTSMLSETSEIPYDNEREMLTFITTLIETSFAKALAWAIESLKTDTLEDTKKYDIQEVIPLECSTVYVFVTIKDIPYKTFILDIIRIFIEILKISLVSREKEHTLITLADKAESANRSKDMFLANMSHELRTPLNAIIGFSQVLQHRPEIPQNMRSYIEKISISGNNLLNLVNTILDFAKLEAGKISYHPKMTMLSELLKEVVVIITPLAQAKNITLEFPPMLSLALYIDVQLMKQVLINILSNAVKFTPQNGKVSLLVDFDKQLKKYVISICDTGVGIAQNELNSLFTPFTQIDNALPSSSKGTGLGLVISKRIVEDLHGGRIWVESELNRGTCFHIAIATPQEQSKVEIFASKNNDVEKLLIVEDTQEYVHILINKLNDKYDITVTNSLSKAKELLHNNQYDKIILDFFLIDGISSEVLTFMQERSLEIPVYIVSAEDDYKIVEYIKESSNVVGVFNKTDIEAICNMLTKDNNE